MYYGANAPAPMQPGRIALALGLTPPRGARLPRERVGRHFGHRGLNGCGSLFSPDTQTYARAAACVLVQPLVLGWCRHRHSRDAAVTAATARTGTRTSASTPPHSHLFPACTAGIPTRAHLHAITSYDTNKSSGNGRCFSRVLARSRCLPIRQRLRYPLVNRLG